MSAFPRRSGGRGGPVRRRPRRLAAVAALLVLGAGLGAVMLSREGARAATRDLTYACTGLGTVTLTADSIVSPGTVETYGSAAVAYTLTLPPVASIHAAALDHPAMTASYPHVGRSYTRATAEGGSFRNVSVTSASDRVHVEASEPAGGRGVQLPVVTITVSISSTLGVGGGMRTESAYVPAPTLTLTLAEGEIVVCTPAAGMNVGAVSVHGYFGTVTATFGSSSRTTSPTTSDTAPTTPGTTVPTSTNPTITVPTTLPTTVPTTTPTTVPTTRSTQPTSPICGLAKQVPQWLWRLVVELFGLHC